MCSQVGGAWARVGWAVLPFVYVGVEPRSCRITVYAQGLYEVSDIRKFYLLPTRHSLWHLLFQTCTTSKAGETPPVKYHQGLPDRGLSSFAGWVSPSPLSSQAWSLLCSLSDSISFSTTFSPKNGQAQWMTLISSKEVCLNQTGLESSHLTLIFVIMMIKQLPLIVNYPTPGTIPTT